jgi:phosphoglycolate phosphatase
MNKAFDDVFGVARAFDGVQMAGRTDEWILQDAASRAGIRLNGDSRDRFRCRYLVHLAAALALPHPGSRPLPGVPALLDAIQRRDDMFAALLTGNCEGGARLKLEHFDLWRFFPCGGYGDDATDRNHLFDVAVERAQSCGCTVSEPSHVVVIGDTVLDVACAQSAGARSIAVATGPSDVETLRASGADLVLGDLADTSHVLRFLQRAH